MIYYAATAKIWKHQCPWRDQWITKMCYRYTMEYYLATKKEENPAFCNYMDGP